MDRKAQGLSLNTIIVAIIVLIVLVVLIMVFTGYFGTRFTPQVTSCSNAGGECKFECGFDAFGNSVTPIAADCSGAQVCCPKGLGSGDKAAAADPDDCGNENVAPCSSGQACKSKGDVAMISFSGVCKVPCTESSWDCSAWSTCSAKTQTRTCTLKDSSCGGADSVKPASSQSC